MKTPPPIKPGDKIRIVSPAGKVAEKYVLPAVEWLVAQGYRVELGKHVFDAHFQFAGNDVERLEDLQTALDDPETAAIICSRGGYGTVRIIDKIDFRQFKKNPKWLVGFSDITILHAAINQLGIATIHGAMPRFFFNDNDQPNENLGSLMELLKGNQAEYQIDAQPENRNGKCVAEMVGGNLSIIVSLLGTKYGIDSRGKILFIEDIDEYLYHTDRMMHQLKLAGKMENLAGLVVGDFTDVKDNESPFGKTVHEIIAEAVAEYDYPVCFGFPAGHDKRNLALTFGMNWELTVLEKEVMLRKIVD
jgi:muramoyltetrapeptide carboxypeptidase